MKRSNGLVLAIACLAAPIALASCKKAEAPQPPPPAVEAPKAAAPPAPAPFRVAGVEVGNALAADKRIAAPTTTLAPSDTIYASVATEGSASDVELIARWTYEGDTLVNEESLSIAPSGPANTEFHIAKPDGWPTGKYKIEILAGGSTAAAKEFEVR